MIYNPVVKVKNCSGKTIRTEYGIFPAGCRAVLPDDFVKEKLPKGMKVYKKGNWVYPSSK